MNAYQIVILAFGLFVVVTSIAGVIVVARSAEFKRKPLWIIGCLFGFAGIGINWSSPDDLMLLFGIQIPVVIASKIMPDGPIIVKAFFPFIAAAVLFKLAVSDPPSAS